MAQPDIPLQDVPPNPDLLPVPSSRTFKIFAEHVSHRNYGWMMLRLLTCSIHQADPSGAHLAQLYKMASARNERQASESSSTSDSGCPLKKARRRADLVGKHRSKDEWQGKREAEKKDIEWLQEQASSLPGYADFCANRGRKLTNAERVKFWAFAATFANDHHRQFSGAQVPYI
jgi:hypothetical protein